MVLVNNPHCIIHSEVGPPLLNQIRYHLPTIGILNHVCKPQLLYKRKIFLYDKGDYNSFKQQLSAIEWDALLDNNDIDSAARNITDKIIEAANTCIPNRLITIRKDDPRGLLLVSKSFYVTKIEFTKEQKSLIYQSIGKNSESLEISVISW